MKKLLLLWLCLPAGTAFAQVDQFTSLYNISAHFSDDDSRVILECGKNWHFNEKASSWFDFDHGIKIFSSTTGALLSVDTTSKDAKAYDYFLDKHFYGKSLFAKQPITIDYPVVLAQVTQVMKDKGGVSGKRGLNEVRYLGQVPEGDHLFYAINFYPRNTDKDKFIMAVYHPKDGSVELTILNHGQSPLVYVLGYELQLSPNGACIYGNGTVYDRKTLKTLVAYFKGSPQDMLNVKYNVPKTKLSATGDSLIFYSDNKYSKEVYVYNWKTDKAAEPFNYEKIIPKAIGNRSPVEIYQQQLQLPGYKEYTTWGYEVDSYQGNNHIEDVSRDGNRLLYKTSTRMWIYNRKTKSVTFLYDQTMDRPAFLKQLNNLNSFLAQAFVIKQKSLQQDIQLDEIRRAREKRESDAFWANRDVCPNCKGSGLVSVIEAKQLTPDYIYKDLNGNTVKIENGLTSYHNTGKASACPVCGGSGHVKK